MSVENIDKQNQTEGLEYPKSWQDEKIKAILDFYRGLLLDAVQPEITEIWRWRPLRSRMLKVLGDRGLEGKLLEVIGSSNKTQIP